MPPVDPADVTSNLGSGGGSYLPPSSMGSGSRSVSKGAADSPSESVNDSHVERQAEPKAGPPSGEDRYLPGEELGRGGWGRVTRARDKQLDRDVAVKRINRELTGASTIAERFFQEARVTGRLQHPGIVPVHELGVGEDGAPFYVMKLLEGVTFKDTIRSAHAQPEPLAGGFSVELLDRFSDICNAIAYAHQQGILHRDLKPSNIMIGRFGETIVVDWGLAKEIDLPKDPEAEEGDPEATFGSKFFTPAPLSSPSRTPRTGSGSNAVLGTPAYMSPEQSEGESGSLTPATDIYALGVILYEVLTGENPFRSKDIETTLSRVRAGEYKPPRAVNKRVPRALAAICTIAMARRPEGRYERAEQIVEDIQSFLAGESVSTYRDPWWSHALRWCRRRPALTAGVLGSVVVLTVSSMLFGAVIHRAHRAEQRARLAAEESRQQALERLAESREAGDAWLVGLSGSLRHFPGMEGLRAELLEEATKHYTRLASNLSATPSTGSASQRLETAKCQLRLGDLNRLQSRTEAAQSHYQQAIEILEHGVIDWEQHAELANARIGLALLGKKIDLSNDRVWLAQQLASDQLSHEATNQAANTVARLAVADARKGSLGPLETIASLRSAQGASEALVIRRGEPRDHQLLQTVRDELGQRLSEAGRLREARAVWSAEVDRLQNHLANHPKRPDLLQSLAFVRAELAGLDQQLQNQDEAIAGHHAAIEDLRRAWRLSDSDSYFRRNVAASYASLGRLASDESIARGHLTKAIDQLRQAVAVEGPSANDLSRLAECYQTLGTISNRLDEETALGHFLSAEQCYEVLSDHGQLTAELTIRRLDNFAALADYQHRHGQIDKAMRHLTRAEALFTIVAASTDELGNTQRAKVERIESRLRQLRIDCEAANEHAQAVRRPGPAI